MNAYLRTLPLPGAVRPVREHGSSALDRAVVAWPAPKASARVLDHWGMPPRAADVPAQWPAPDPVMRFDLPAPDRLRSCAPTDGRIPWTDLVEPRVVVTVPDLHSASHAAMAIAPPTVAAPTNNWPAPTPASATPLAPAEPKRGRMSTRVKIGMAAAAGVVAAGAASVVAFF